MTTLHATNTEAHKYIVGPYNELNARLEAAGIEIDWTNALPLIGADDDIIGVTTDDDPEPLIFVDRLGERWIAHSGATDAAMRPRVAASLGIGQNLFDILTVYVNGHELIRAWEGSSEINDDEAVRLADMISDALNSLGLGTKNNDVLEFVGINVPNVPPFAVMTFGIYYGSKEGPVLQGTYTKPREDVMDVLRNTENTQLAVFGEWLAWRDSRCQQ